MAKPATGNEDDEWTGRFLNTACVGISYLYRYARDSHEDASLAQPRAVRVGCIAYDRVGAIVTLLVTVSDGDEFAHIDLRWAPDHFSHSGQKTTPERIRRGCRQQTTRCAKEVACRLWTSIRCLVMTACRQLF